MGNGVVLTYAVLNILFAAGGGLILAVALTTQASLSAGQTLQNVATDLLLGSCPLKAGVINSIMIFITFVLSLPGIVSSTNRFVPKVHGYLVVVNGLFTLILGLLIWFETLKTRANLTSVWSAQPAATQSLLQQKFQCCGYLNFTTPPFIQDSTCTNQLVAANLGGCVTPFASFANIYLDVIFTADFGIVAVDALLLLAIACVLKDRKEKERYRLIDEKNGTTAI